MVNADLPTPPPPTITNLYSVILNVCLCVCLFFCCLELKNHLFFILFPAPSLKGFTSLNGLKIKKITLPPPELNKITQEISSYLGKGKTFLHLAYFYFTLEELFRIHVFCCNNNQLGLGDKTNRNIPEKVNNVPKISSLFTCCHSVICR